MQAVKTLQLVVGRYPLDPRAIGLPVPGTLIDIDLAEFANVVGDVELDEALASRCGSL